MTNARLEELRAKFQENPRRYFAPFANELRKAGDPAQAIAVCRTHLTGQPGHVSGHIVLGQALYEAGESNEARDIFTAALELDPENLIALRTLGEIAQVNGEFSAARQWYERLLDADPRNSEVAQLLKDIPAEAPAGSVAAAPATEVAEEPTPLSVRLDAEAAPPAPEPTPRPLFHTSFSGSMPAYDPDKPAPEVQSAATASGETDEAFIDLEPTASDTVQEPETEPEGTIAHTARDESLELVDYDSPAGAPADEPESHESLPDEFATYAAETSQPPETVHVEPLSFDGEEEAPEFEPSETSGFTPPDTSEFSPPEPSEFAPLEASEFAPTEASEFAPADGSEFAPPEASQFAPADASEFAPPEESEPAGEEADVASADAFTLAEETPEPPRALFAERGFDGPAEDEAGWMPTPSAAYSDLEAAPEEWFDESAALDAGDISAHAESGKPAEASAEDPATDSWFDEVEGAATIESTEVTTDEFWLPPELPQVTTPEAAEPQSESEPGSPRAPAEEPQAAEEPSADEQRWAPPTPIEAVSGSEAPDEAAVQSWSSAEDYTAPAEPPEAIEPAVSEAPTPVGSEETDRPWMPAEAESAAVEMEPTPAETTGLDVGALADAGEDAVVVEHPVEASTDSTWSDSGPAPAPEPDEAVEPVSIETGTEVIFAGHESATDSGARSDAVIGHTPELAPEHTTPAPAPFVTETLAELYLQQGFREEALSIYRQLSERNPDDQELRNRISAIEQGESPQPVRAEVPAATRAASQSVRTFFSRLARRAAVPPSPIDPQIGSPAATANPDVPFASAASALANLFAASRPPASDENAASTLAGAFSDPAGRPSRAADRELSLDHLFRDVASGGSPAGGVTLDEFYATPNAAPDSPTESRDAEGSDDPGGTDIRQFTAWLEGLRKK